MSHRFLTLEGAPRPRRSISLLDFGLGAGLIRPAEKRPVWPHDIYRETDEAEAAERTRASRAHLWKPVNEDEKAPSIFSQYEDAGMEDDGLGFWKRIRRMVTPPARVRRSFARVTRPFVRAVTPPRSVRNFAGKALRYAGAANTLPLTAFGGSKLRNKVFGLKGREVGAFDAAAKVYRIGAIATVSIAGAPAIAGSMSKLAASRFLAFAGKGKAGLGFLMKGGSAILKDPATNAVWKLAADTAGNIVGSKLTKESMPAEDYNSLPAFEPVPVNSTLDESASPSMPATVAGSGSMGPGNAAGDPQLYGEMRPYDEAEVMEQTQLVPFPTATTPDPMATPVDPEQDFDDLIVEAQRRAREVEGPDAPEPEPRGLSPESSEIINDILGYYEDSDAIERDLKLTQEVNIEASRLKRRLDRARGRR